MDSSAGTSGEKGTGFGLPLVKTFVEENQNIFQINTEPQSLLSFPDSPNKYMGVAT
jgi:signal transduction histidine kinase